MVTADVKLPDALRDRPEAVLFLRRLPRVEDYLLGLLVVFDLAYNGLLRLATLFYPSPAPAVLVLEEVELGEPLAGGGEAMRETPRTARPPITRALIRIALAAVIGCTSLVLRSELKAFISNKTFS